MHRALGLLLILASLLAGGCASAPSMSPSAEASLPSLEPIPVERGTKNPEGAALGVVNGSCVASADVDFAPANLAVVDLAIVAAGGSWGLYDAGGRKAYFGPVEGAARAFGAAALFIGVTGDAWIRIAPGEAHQLVAEQSPAHRALWMEKNVSQRTECPAG